MQTENYDHATSRVASETGTYLPPDIAPAAADMLGFSSAEANCDIKVTSPKTKVTPPKTRAKSHVRSTATISRRQSALGRRQAAVGRPALYTVKNGHAAQPPQDVQPWHLTASGKRRRTYAGRPISYAITDQDRVEAYTRWRHAEERGTPFTRFATFAPPVDDLDPVERITLWERLRQRVRCFCRDCRAADTGRPLECVMITTRESDPKDSSREHLHMLLHVPPEHQAAFDRQAPGWAQNTHVRPTGHAEAVLPSGKVESGFGYLHKAASPQARRRDKTIWYRNSGAILGDRVFATRNLHTKARSEFETERAAAVRLHRERDQVRSVVARRSLPPISRAAPPMPDLCDGYWASLSASYLSELHRDGVTVPEC